MTATAAAPTKQIPLPSDAKKAPVQEAAPKRISLAERTEKRRRIPVPSFFERASSMTRKARALHNMTAEEAFTKTSDVAERVTGEVAGAVSAVVRVAGGTIFGGLKGLAFGTRGASPMQLKKIRINAEKLDEIGKWTHFETRTIKDKEVTLLVMSLTTDLNGEAANPSDEYTAPLAAASRETVRIGHDDHSMVCIPIRDEETDKLEGFLVASEMDNKVYRFIDA